MSELSKKRKRNLRAQKPSLVKRQTRATSATVDTPLEKKRPAKKEEFSETFIKETLEARLEVEEQRKKGELKFTSDVDELFRWIEEE